MVKLVDGPIYPANVYNSICSAFSGSVVFHYAIVKKQAGSGKSTTSIEYRATGDTLQELEGVAVELERHKYKNTQFSGILNTKSTSTQRGGFL